jgi:acetyl esterase/lipase
MKYISIFISLLLAMPVFSQDSTGYSQQEVIYGRRDGMALTMLVLTPSTANGKAIISLNSGNWVSSNYRTDRLIDKAKPFIKSGYTVFLTMHCSAPRYAIPDAIKDVQRAVQYVRHNAAVYHIDSSLIGITGTSSGGHLSLCAGTANDIMNVKSGDPVERVSSKVQAVAVFCPPTDFLNYGKEGISPAGQKKLLQELRLLGAFNFTEWDAKKYMYVPVDDEAKKLSIDSLVSPAQMVTADDAPTYMMHGDKDILVPMQQSKWMEQKLKAAKVPVELSIKEGAGHGWKSMTEDQEHFIRWFDTYLQVKR